MSYLFPTLVLVAGAAWVAWWILFRENRDDRQPRAASRTTSITALTPSEIADRKLRSMERHLHAFLKRVHPLAFRDVRTLKRRVMLELPSDIAAEIKTMAQADFRSFDDELAYLLRRGLRVPRSPSSADELSLIAELAYLRAEQLDESSEE